ncbi:hypothetical protein BCR42DRAFT_11869 [Absidia repens]|uniref:Uncharacterized protein n=1 Tax=Absidia repens TaxID=90262 RepID=A0A1X2J199_9FUNG|nr:hypothetical protein BCR42DRAFT_11869 [Absidia repens]
MLASVARCILPSFLGEGVTAILLVMKATTAIPVRPPILAPYIHSTMNNNVTNSGNDHSNGVKFSKLVNVLGTGPLLINPLSL